MSVNMQTLWQRVDAQIVRHEQTKCVTPPRVASDEEIFEVEQLLGVKLPDELKLFYQKFSHDWAWRLGGWIIQPLPDLGILTDTMSEKIVYDNLFVDDEQYWNPKWIDFAEDLEGKKFMCLNLERDNDVAESAERIFIEVEEVFEFDMQEGCILRKGVNFRDWLENLLTELEAQPQTLEIQSKE